MVLDAESTWDKIYVTRIVNEWKFENFRVSERISLFGLLWQLEYLPFLKPPTRGCFISVLTGKNKVRGTEITE